SVTDGLDLVLHEQSPCPGGHLVVWRTRADARPPGAFRTAWILSELPARWEMSYVTNDCRPTEPRGPGRQENPCLSNTWQDGAQRWHPRYETWERAFPTPQSRGLEDAVVAALEGLQPAVALRVV